MYVGVACLFLFIGAITVSQLVLNRKWKLIYTALNYEDYFKVVASLKNAGIKYKTNSPMNVRSTRSRFNDYTQYDIYVKKEAEHTALNALHHKDR